MKAIGQLFMVTLLLWATTMLICSLIAIGSMFIHF